MNGELFPEWKEISIQKLVVDFDSVMQQVLDDLEDGRACQTDLSIKK